MVRTIKTSNNGEQPTRELSDSMLLAYLDFRGAILKPHTDNKGRVFFIVTSPNLDDLIMDYYNNPLVRLADYLTSLRKVKTIIFDLKDSAH